MRSTTFWSSERVSTEKLDLEPLLLENFYREHHHFPQRNFELDHPIEEMNLELEANNFKWIKIVGYSSLPDHLDFESPGFFLYPDYDPNSSSGNEEVLERLKFSLRIYHKDDLIATTLDFTLPHKEENLNDPATPSAYLAMERLSFDTFIDNFNGTEDEKNRLLCKYSFDEFMNSDVDRETKKKLFCDHF